MYTQRDKDIYKNRHTTLAFNLSGSNGAEVSEQGQYYTAEHLCLFMSVCFCIISSSTWSPSLSVSLPMSCVSDGGGNERRQDSVLLNSNDITLY